jgi:Leucine-rich repeat (LRR) protein
LAHFLFNSDAVHLTITIEEFDVSDNQMRGSIFTDIHELTNLRVLSLMQNEISGTFPPFTSNSLLHSLSLSETLIGGTTPTYWYNLTQLENLDLFNLETAIGNFSLLLQMTKLINLRIGGEVDTAGDWGALPEKIGALSQLEGIDTSYAWRSGTVPTTIGLLTNLSKCIRYKMLQSHKAHSSLLL